jgi:hypothetical protein
MATDRGRNTDMRSQFGHLRRRLTVGTEFTAEYVGMHVDGWPEGTAKTRRRVLSNSIHRMRTVMLDAAEAGKDRDLLWYGIRVERTGPDRFDLTDRLGDESGPFLRITFQVP